MRDWLESRRPAPPPALARRLAGIVENESCAATDLSLHLLSHAKGILADIGNGREYAEHLLAADALITYSMEAAAELGREPGQAAARAMHELSRR